MPKPMKLRLVVNTLLRNGFFFVSQNGSHTKYRSAGIPVRTVIVSIHGNEIPHGTFRSILRQSGLQEEDFRK